MTLYLSKAVSWCCLLVIVSVPIAGGYLLIDIEHFAALASSSLPLPIYWESVASWQWYVLWVISAIYVGVGLVGVYYLRLAFVGFALGEYFRPQNSRYLRMFSIFLFVQALAKPVHGAAASILLSLNHPPGQKMLSISLGSDGLKVIVLAMVLWVISDLLVKGGQIDNENKQFI